MLQCLIHCADLGNPAKPVDLAADWAKRITQEHFLQGDDEKRLGIPINPLGDRDQVCLGKCQVRDEGGPVEKEGIGREGVREVERLIDIPYSRVIWRISLISTYRFAVINTSC